MTELHMDPAATLWFPGKSMGTEYPVPEPHELAGYWAGYAGGTVQEAPGVYGALRAPDGPPAGHASVDVCEVLRDSCGGFRSAYGLPVGESVHDYRGGIESASDEDVTSVLQVMMSAGLVRPTSSIEQIAEMLRRWRALGIYVVANTSTLPGCERGTIDFFRTYLPKAIDGIVLPRNHDGTGAFTKGHAAARVVEAVPPASGGVVAVHIDDAPHHNAAFRQVVGALPGAQVATFQPVYRSHLPVDEGSVAAPTPYGAFVAADQFFRQRLTS